eukprot:scaffold151220_cov56-Attheya_sp.AAC.6
MDEDQGRSAEVVSVLCQADDVLHVSVWHGSTVRDNSFFFVVGWKFCMMTTPVRRHHRQCTVLVPGPASYRRLRVLYIVVPGTSTHDLVD